MPADTPTDAKRLAEITRRHSIDGDTEVAFLLRLLDEREAEIARLQGAQDALSDLPDCMESADDEPCDGFKALQSELDELHRQMDDPTALTAASQSARETALEEARDRIMSLLPNDDDLKSGVRPAFRNGYAAAKYAARTVIGDMISEDEDRARVITPKGEGT